MALQRTNPIELPTGEKVPVLYEDRSVLAIDKPPGWMLAPDSWQQTSRNLQSFLVQGIAEGAFWARSRSLKFLRFVHRLDAETSGILLLARSSGALRALSALFETRNVAKVYLAVVHGRPKQDEWTCRLKIGPDPNRPARMKPHSSHGKEAITQFQLLKVLKDTALLQARPLTGRTHQIRVHLAASGHPVVGDELYQRPEWAEAEKPPIRRATAQQAFAGNVSLLGQPEVLRLGLRAVALEYRDPFTHRSVRIQAPQEEFLSEFGFNS